jgi:pimeloyl-ACP methyl ester carboxylesterase
MEPDYVLGMSAAGFHRIAFVQWGSRTGRTVVCVHGLTRNGRDFDALAERLGDGYHVVCPDIVGRGRSDWLPGGADYGYPQYLSDMATLIAWLGVRELDWVGTSMGGLIGLMLAAMPNSPISRLVLNDVGPFLPKAALERIGGYVAERPTFSSIEEAAAHLARVHAGFGPLTGDQWRHLAEHSVRPATAGFELRIDPAVGAAYLATPIADVDLWATWEQVRVPVLVLRGAQSDLLTAETARRMAERDGVELVEFAGCGHAPSLMSADHARAITDWLERTVA